MRIAYDERQSSWAPVHGRSLSQRQACARCGFDPRTDAETPRQELASTADIKIGSAGLPIGETVAVLAIFALLVGAALIRSGIVGL